MEVNLFCAVLDNGMVFSYIWARAYYTLLYNGIYEKYQKKFKFSQQKQLCFHICIYIETRLHSLTSHCGGRNIHKSECQFLTAHYVQYMYL